MNARNLTVQAVTAAAENSTASRFIQTINFPVRILGQSNAPTFPRIVGNWWVEPLSQQTKLPKRAQERLQFVMQSGVPVKDVVLFHELAVDPPKPSPLIKVINVAASWARWWLEEHRRETARIREASRLRRIERLRNIDLLRIQRDPCLVVVLEDGTWIEIDRWYD